MQLYLCSYTDAGVSVAEFSRLRA